ncbi:NACHT domain-containing protein [Kitasatospora sp. NPDC101447]|uniref:NACHT domain-containing protein n=1 Tax=Kitasatospora sp. NPDC101447 TaxID=3364102 RepID=UPI00380E9254
MTSNRFSGGQARTVHQAEVINLYGGPQPTTTDPDARRLALAVARQWRDEAAARGLFGPVPLPVPWRADRHLADRTELAGALPEGSSADLAAFAEAFLALPERRLVVLGDAGSGKTSLAVLLLLALIDRLGPDDPVPVLVPLASWNPARQGLRDWLAERLRTDYPSLPVPRLLAEGRVLPVLDGFDELPPAQQAPALRLLNRTLAAGDPVVLTSRTDEYRQAAKEARVLNSSAAVRARPITPAGVAETLRDHAGPQHLPRWQPLIDGITTDPTGPLARTLANPLLLALTREIHDRAGSDPADLLRFDDRTALTRHLLDRFVPTVMPDAVQVLAEMARADGPDLAWWRLHRRLVRPSDNRANFFGSMLVAGFFWLPFSAFVPGRAPLHHALLAVLLGAAFGLSSGGYEHLGRAPGTRSNHPWPDVRKGLRFLIPMALMSTAATLAARTHGLVMAAALPGALLAAYLTASGLKKLAALWIRRVARSLSAAHDSGPAAALAGGRGRAVLTALPVGAAVGLLVAVTAPGDRPPEAVGAVYFLAYALTVLLATEWGAYSLARLLLAARGRIPLRYAAFLAEARARGVLRQAGSVYQFRHEALRARLAHRGEAQE